MLTDAELLSLACEFNVGPVPLLGGRPFWWRYFSDDPRLNSVTVRNMGGKVDRWAILDGNSCLDKSGHWTYQPNPSNRTDEFYDECRYDSAQDAIAYYRRWKRAVEEYVVDKHQGIALSADGPLLPLDEYKKVIVNYEEIPTDLLKY